MSSYLRTLPNICHVWTDAVATAIHEPYEPDFALHTVQRLADKFRYFACAESLVPLLYNVHTTAGSYYILAR